MIFITHRLPEVVALCDRATVLRDGRVAAEFARGDFDEERIIAAMSGERLQPPLSPPRRPARRTRATLLRVEGLAVEARYGSHLGVHDVSLRSSGRRDPRHRRAARLGPKRAARRHLWPHPASRPHPRRRPGGRHPLDPRCPRRRHRPPHRGSQGIGPALQPAGRRQHHHRQPRRSSRRSGVVSRKSEESAALRAMRELKVRARSSAAAVAHLSGGNQQKLLFARVLMNAPRILLLDEPTKGVDVGTRHEIYKLVVELADHGVGLVVVSSELEEVVGLCDRVLVFDDGRIVDVPRPGRGDRGAGAPADRGRPGGKDVARRRRRVPRHDRQSGRVSSDKAILVTGAATGIGRATAERAGRCRRAGLRRRARRRGRDWSSPPRRRSTTGRWSSGRPT